MTEPAIQTNPYKGAPPQPWITVTLRKADGSGVVQKQLAVDTGDPHELTVDRANMAQLKVADGPTVRTNFGRADGG